MSKRFIGVILIVVTTACGGGGGGGGGGSPTTPPPAQVTNKRICAGDSRWPKSDPQHPISTATANASDGTSATADAEGCMTLMNVRTSATFTLNAPDFRRRETLSVSAEADGSGDTYWMVSTDKTFQARLETYQSPETGVVRAPGKQYRGDPPLVDFAYEYEGDGTRKSAMDAALKELSMITFANYSASTWKEVGKSEPGLGTVILIPDSGLRGMGTKSIPNAQGYVDGIVIKYNPSWVAARDADSVTARVVHELVHGFNGSDRFHTTTGGINEIDNVLKIDDLDLQCFRTIYRLPVGE